MKSLKSISDKELVSRLRGLVRKEQNLTLEILPHLAEVGARGLYLAKGYGCLYEYCKNELGYTDASAWRRVRAALAIQRCPEAFARLSEGRVTMCALGRIYKFVTPEILEKIRDKSQAEVELIAAVFDANPGQPRSRFGGLLNRRARPRVGHNRRFRSINCRIVPRSAPAYSHSAAASGSTCCSRIRAGLTGARRILARGRSRRGRSKAAIQRPARGANSTRRQG